MERGSKQRKIQFSPEAPRAQRRKAPEESKGRKARRRTDFSGAHHGDANAVPVGPRPTPRIEYPLGEKRYSLDYHYSGSMVHDYPDHCLSRHITHGKAAHQRIGNRLLVTNINIRGALRLVGYYPAYRAESQPSPFLPYNRCRIVVLVDRFPASNLEVSQSEVFNREQDISYVDAFRNVNTLERFQILYDEVYNVGYAHAGFVTMADFIAPPPPLAGAEPPVPIPRPAIPDGSEMTQFYGIPGFVSVNISLKTNIVTEYKLPEEDVPEAHGTPLRNSIFTLMIPEHGHITQHDQFHLHRDIVARLKFYDV